MEIHDYPGIYRPADWCLFQWNRQSMVTRGWRISSTLHSYWDLWSIEDGEFDAICSLVKLFFVQVFPIEATDFDLLASSHLNDPRLLAAFKIVMFCWVLKETSLICDKCCREISITSTKLTLDPIVSHRAWCPILKNNQWKQRIAQIEGILHKKSRDKFGVLPTNADVIVFTTWTHSTVGFFLV